MNIGTILAHLQTPPVLAAESGTGLFWQPRFELWPLSLPMAVVVVLLALAGWWIVRLYEAQRQIAPARTVQMLMGIRLALLGLLLILIMRPTLVWERKTSSAGTLWIMIDRSLSMGMTDPQSTDLEKLRWADGLGYLPEGTRPGRPDVVLAQLMAVHDLFGGLRPAASEAMAANKDPKAVAALAESLETWCRQAEAVDAAMGRDAVVSDSGGGIRAAMQEAVAAANQGARQARRCESLREAASEETARWGVIQANLDAAARDLRTLADRADEQFLNDHRSDPTVVNALARVTNISRTDLAAQCLSAGGKRSKQTLQSLLPMYRTKLVAFSDSAQVIPVTDASHFHEAMQQAVAPTGKATSLAAGLQMIGEQSSGAASVIILSDGRQNVPGDPTESARLLAARGIRVNTLLMGSQEVSPDASVDPPDAPEWIFKDDTVKVGANIRLDGLMHQTLRVELLRNGQTIDARPVTARRRQDVVPVSFSNKPGTPGVYQYEVRVQASPTETNTLNNSQKFRVSVKKDKLAVLAVEEYPRWEYQFLINTLERDQSLKLQSVLFAPAEIRGVTLPEEWTHTKASPANPRREAALLPQTSQEWEAFDVIILGDLTPERLTPAQWQFLEAAVRDKGATLILIAGRRSMPARFANTPLANLLPVDLGAASIWNTDQLDKHLRTGFRPAVAPEAGASVLAQWDPDVETSLQRWAQVPAWYWHSPFTQVKPSAGVLWWIAEPGARGAPAAATPGETLRQRALLSSISIGMGRCLYLASDQTWRLRNVGGDDLDSRFWGQVIRWAVGSDLPAGGRFVRFGVNRPQVLAGDPVTVTIRLLREDLTPYTGQSFDVLAARVGGPEGARDLDAAERQTVGSAGAREQREAPGYYRATFSSLPAGTIELSLKGFEVERLLNEDPAAAQKTLLLQVQEQINLEQRDMNTSATVMEAVARAGGGIALSGAYSDVLATSLPRLEQTYVSRQQIGFFTAPNDRHTRLTHWVFLAAFALLITAEWMLRKRAGLI